MKAITSLALAILGAGLCLLLAPSMVSAQTLERHEVHSRIELRDGRPLLVARVGVDASIRALVTRMIEAGASGTTDELQIRIAASSGAIRYVCDTRRDRFGHAHARRTESRNPAHWQRCPNGPRHLGLVDHTTYRIPLSPTVAERLTASEARVSELETELRELRVIATVQSRSIDSRASENHDASLVAAVMRADEARFARERSAWRSSRWTERVSSALAILIVAVLAAFVIKQSFNDHYLVKALRQRASEKDNRLAAAQRELVQLQAANAEYANFFAARQPTVTPLREQEKQRMSDGRFEQAGRPVNRWDDAEGDDVWSERPQVTVADGPDPYDELLERYRREVNDHAATQARVRKLEWDLRVADYETRLAIEREVELEHRLSEWSLFFLRELPSLYQWIERTAGAMRRVLDDVKDTRASWLEMLDVLHVSEGLCDEPRRIQLVSRLRAGLADLHRLTNAMLDNAKFVAATRSGLLGYGVSLLVWTAYSDGCRTFQRPKLLPAPHA